MEGIIRIYFTACIKDGKNFNTIPKKIQPQVRELIEDDGYEILEDGTVVIKNKSIAQSEEKS